MGSMSCACPCGEVRLRLARPPIARYLCHCAICQEVHGLAFADTTVARGSRVEVEGAARMVLERRRSPPFAVRCGTCRSCAHPVIGYTSLLGVVDLALIPAALYKDPRELPTAGRHLFYAKRVRDVDDDLPKHLGFVASELAFGRLVLAGLTTLAKGRR